MARPKEHELAPRIENRRALHEYHIEAKLECGIVLVGSEVKSIRHGLAQLTDSFAKIERDGSLVMHGCHIDPYSKAGLYTHEPKRPRALLAHKREINRLAAAVKQEGKGGATLIPLAMYFKEGRVKVELAIARGKQSHDKRASIKERELKAEIRRATTTRR